MAEVNYYEELKLNPNDSLEELNGSLNQLETVWKRREINTPEKATKMLSLIIDARKVFKSSAAKAEYDRNLASERKPQGNEDLDAGRHAQFEKYKAQAATFFNENQNDLAFESMKLALTYKEPNDSDAQFSYLCSVIRYKADDYRGAFLDISDAIEADGRNASYYRWKAFLSGELFNLAIETADGLQTARSYLSQNRRCYEKGLDLARQSGDRDEQIACLEGLADSYSLMYDSDFELAGSYVKEARRLGDTNPELETIIESIKQGKSEHQPYQGKKHPSSTQGGGCYIATAVYGSYDCPEVWTLRRYRDLKLSKTIYGRMFIKVYYTISPWLVKRFGRTRFFNRFWKRRLDRMVQRLNQKGCSDEMYFD